MKYVLKRQLNLLLFHTHNQLVDLKKGSGLSESLSSQVCECSTILRSLAPIEYGNEGVTNFQNRCMHFEIFVILPCFT